MGKLDLESAAEHIKYEVDMFCFIGEKSLNGYKPNTPAEMCLLIDNFVLHSRNLYDFLYLDKKKYTNDILWSDFISEENKKIFIDKRLASSFDKQKANTQLAHLSYKRNTIPDKSRNIPKIYKEIFKTYELFISLLDEEQKHLLE